MVRVITAIEVVEVEQQDTGRTEPRRIGPGLRHWVPGVDSASNQALHDRGPWLTRCGEQTTGMIVEVTTSDRVSCPRCQVEYTADYLIGEELGDGA